MLRPTAGQVFLNEIPLGRVPSVAWTDVGQVIDTPLTYGDLTTQQNLLLAARLHNPSSPSATDIEAAMATFGLERYAAVRARRLSAGNRQRVGLACALQHHPHVIVLDEPGNTLDPAGTLMLRDELRRLRDEGAGILVSSHHLDEVARIADRISTINAGRLIGGLDPQTADLEHAFFAQVLGDDQEHGRA
jgi:ABC-2 type transport system ATP-binding protein